MRVMRTGTVTEIVGGYVTIKFDCSDHGIDYSGDILDGFSVCGEDYGLDESLKLNGVERRRAERL